METWGFLVFFSGQTRLIITWREAPLMISGTLTCLLPLPLLEGLPTVTTFCSLVVADNEWNGFLLTWSKQSLYYLRRMISQAYITLKTSKVRKVNWWHNLKVRKGNFTNSNLKYFIVYHKDFYIYRTFILLYNQPMFKPYQFSVAKAILSLSFIIVRIGCLGCCLVQILCEPVWIRVID